ncbi:hypothetical protein GO485_22400 [Pseudoduganella flava]|uniref:Plastocyanin n=1 Tax=Pseudoduganella flava TaxID=871742 RepID=A0ABX6G1I8_9BURK|nr:hypothetical protein GO485_22400 [Pseudoduganella flava]
MRLVAGIAGIVGIAAAGALAWAMFAPLDGGSRDALFEIPPGTWARRMAGEKRDILPQTIRLTLGVRDVLLLRNSDKVPQIFGPVLIMPGQDFRLPFETVSENDFNCTAHSSGTMKVIVEPAPPAGLARLRWRISAALHSA